MQSELNEVRGLRERARFFRELAFELEDGCTKREFMQQAQEIEKEAVALLRRCLRTKSGTRRRVVTWPTQKDEVYATANQYPESPVIQGDDLLSLIEHRNQLLPGV